MDAVAVSSLAVFGLAMFSWWSVKCVLHTPPAPAAAAAAARRALVIDACVRSVGAQNDDEGVARGEGEVRWACAPLSTLRRCATDTRAALLAAHVARSVDRPAGYVAPSTCARWA